MDFVSEVRSETFFKKSCPSFGRFSLEVLLGCQISNKVEIYDTCGDGSLRVVLLVVRFLR